MNKIRKLTSLEKKQKDRLIKAKKDTKTLRKKVNTTMDWMNIREVGEDYIMLKDGNKEAWIRGIKVNPHDIFLDDYEEQVRHVDGLRICLNKLRFKMYYSFVLTKVDVQSYIDQIIEGQRMEDDRIIQTLMDGDIDKLDSFCDAYKELNFFIMIRSSDPKELDKNYWELFNEFSVAGFQPKKLNEFDFYNYIAYVFENTPVPDYYYSRGIFSYENVEMEYNATEDQYELVDNTKPLLDARDAPIENLIPEISTIRQSRMAPFCFSLKPDHYMIGEKYVSNILIKRLPQGYSLGILCDYVNNPNIKLFMTTDTADESIAKGLKMEYQEKERKYYQTRDPQVRQHLQNDLASLNEYIQEILRDTDRTHNVIMVLSVYADDLQSLRGMVKDIKLRMRSIGFMLADARYLEEAVLRISCPLFFKAKSPFIVEQNFGFLLPSRGVAGLWPYVFETLKDPKGMLLGCELQNKGIIMFDPFFYNTHKSEARLTQRINGNMIVVGKSGSGKSTTMGLLIRDLIKRKVRIVWIDPENKNRNLTKKYGGTYVAWGQKGNIINIFDLKKITSEEEDGDEKMYDTEIAIYNVIEDINQVLQFLYPNISEDTLTFTGDITFRAYAKVGITRDENGQFASFKGLHYEDMPTFETFNECLEERIKELKEDTAARVELDRLMDLRMKMQRIMVEWSVYFVGHTTVTFTNPERQIIAFGTKALFNASSNLSAALNHIMFKFSWDQCLDNNDQSAFIIDEAHTMILQGSTAPLIAQFYRRARKYNCMMIVGTQEPRDFADDSIITHGKAIFNNSTYKIVMYLDKDACNDVLKLCNFNSNEITYLQNFQLGQAIFICGNRRIPIQIIATEQELREIGVE